MVTKSLLIAGKPYYDTGDTSNIKDVVIVANAGTAANAFAIQEFSGKVSILGMKFIGVPGSVDLLTTQDEIEVGYCIFDGGRDLLSYDSNGYGEVHNCEFRNASDDNIDVDSEATVGGAYIHIHNNLIEDTGDDGIEIRFYSRSNSLPELVYEIHDNIIRGAGKNRGDGIQLIDHDTLESSRIVNIFRNIIDGEGLTEVGIGSLDNQQSNEDFDGADGMNEAVYIYNNTILDTQDYGITGGDHTFVINNIIIDCPRGIKHVSNEGLVDYTLTYNTPNGSAIDIIDAGHNYFNQDPGLIKNTYELNAKSFSVGKGVSTYTDHNTGTTIFTITTQDGSAPNLGAPSLGAIRRIGPVVNVGTDVNNNRCFIATAAHGSAIDLRVEILREFRDRFLLTNNIGSAFVKFYYRHSPAFADFIAKHSNLRAIVQTGLLPVVGLSWVFLGLGLIPSVVLIFLFCCCLVCMIWRKKL